MENNNCFSCGAIGYFKRDCPKKINAGQAQMGVINVKDVRCNNLVQVMIMFCDVSVMFLFDSGCIHSFVSHSSVRKLKIKMKPLEILFHVVKRHKSTG